MGNVERSRRLLLLAALFGVMGFDASKPPSVGSPFDVLPGRWGWENSAEQGCSANPHTIRFSKDRRTMFLSTIRPLDSPTGPSTMVTYRVLRSQPNLRMSIAGETRRTDAGKLVQWDLVLMSRDRYCWHRSDWSADSCTAANVRCR